MHFIKTTIIGGLVFLIPVVVLVVVLDQAFDLMITIAEPMADLVPIDSIGGFAVANLLAVVLILTACFIAGLIARTGPASRALEAAESAILQKIPGYTMLKGITTALSPEQAGHLKPVLAMIGTSKRVGLEVDRLSGSEVVVFVPGSPNAWSGTVHLVDAKLVEGLDIPMTSVIEHSETLGRNSETILAGTSLLKEKAD